MDSRYNMQGKACIVTGANSGIGKAAALTLAKNSATVVTVRTKASEAIINIKKRHEI
jgi:NAD(P)-dependent dehydrogenase (short-subunit alcohol dehydrogenase family)